MWVLAGNASNKFLLGDIILSDLYFLKYKDENDCKYPPGTFAKAITSSSGLGPIMDPIYFVPNCKYSASV